MKKPKHWLGKKCYVYIYYDVDGTPIYVGIGSWPARWREHWKKDTHFGRLLRKRERELGISIYPEFIEADSWGDAQLGEVLYIWCFGRKDKKVGPLLNLTDGGEGAPGRVTSSETRTKMSVARAGKTQTPAHITKRVLTLKGKTRPAAAIASASKPCTVDGITIYPSRKALIDTLGQGKSGRYHPNFRYV